LENTVKQKKRKVTRSIPDKSTPPDWLSDNPLAASKPRQTREELDEIVAGTEKGIRDTHAWKDMVRRVGLKEARRILKLGLLASQLPGSNPQN
jgi:hypothetical protein